MALDGSRRHLALAFAPGSAVGIPEAGALSPGGSRVAYYAGNDLWAADLATGHRVRLGRVSFDGWRNETTVLASATDGIAILLVNAATGSRSAYLTITDAALVHAYQQAAPGAGRPAGMTGEGFSGTGPSAALAVTLSAAGPFGGSRPVEVILAGAGCPVTDASCTAPKFVAASDLRGYRVVHATLWYSLIRPPSTSRRCTGALSGTTTGWLWSCGR